MKNEEERKQHDGERRSFRERYAYPLLFGLAVLVLFTGTGVYHFLEDSSWVDSFYFSSIAITTVGFGDLTPTGDASKLFTVAYVFSAIGVIAHSSTSD